MVDESDIALSIATIILSGLLSYIVASRTGPRAVAKDARKREHSLNLVKGSLVPWLENAEKCCRIGVALKGTGLGDFPLNDGEGGGVILQRIQKGLVSVERGIDVRGAIDLPIEYSAQMWSHLGGVHNDVIVLWNSIKKQVDGQNQEILRFLKILGSEVLAVPSEVQKAELFQNWDGLGESPLGGYLLLNDIIYLLWSEIEDRESGRARRPYQLPQVKTQVSPSGLTLYEIRWKGAPIPLAKTINSEVSEGITEKIAYVCNSTANIEAVREFTRKKSELDAELKSLQQKLREIKAQVDLGGNLAGKCSFCEKIR